MKATSLLLVIGWLVISVQLAFPQTYSSTVSGNWGNGSTWLEGSVPVSGNSVGVGGGNTVTFGSSDAYAGAAVGWWVGLGIGINFGPKVGAGTLNITGGTLDTGGFFVGHDYPGTINLSGGTLNASGQHMLFGWTAGSSLNVSGGTLNMTGSGNLWNFGHGAQCFMNITNSGVANLSGGIALLNYSQINANGGTLNISNASLNVAAGSQLLVNNGGSINLLAGTQAINVAEGCYLGHNGSTGYLNISGGTWQQNTYLRLGVFASGNGIINQTGGTFEMAYGGAGGSIEAWGSSPSAYNLKGGTFRVAASGVQINSYSGGPMTFNITGSSGSATMDTLYDFIAPNSSVFNNAGATLTKTGAGKLTFWGALSIDNGALDMQAGSIEASTAIYIGSNGGSASGTQSGGTLKVGYLGAANFAVGLGGGTGTLTQSGGTNDVGALANVVFGWNSGASGTYALSGGTFSASGNAVYIGLAGGTGAVSVNGGSFVANNVYVGWPSSAPGAGTLNLNGGAVAVSNIYLHANGKLQLDLKGASNTVGLMSLAESSTLNIVSKSGCLTFTGDHSGVAWGSNTLTISGPLGYSAPSRLRFSHASRLSPAQLSRITCNGKRVLMDANGYLLEPAPGTLISVL